MIDEVLYQLISGIVDHPDDLVVNEKNVPRGKGFEVFVHPDDLGRVIGRNGKTVKALKIAVEAVTSETIHIDFVDVE